MTTWILAQNCNFSWEQFYFKANVPISCPHTLREQILHFGVTPSVVNQNYYQRVCQIEYKISDPFFFILILRVIWHLMLIRHPHLSCTFKSVKLFSGLDTLCIRILIYNVFLKLFCLILKCTSPMTLAAQKGGEEGICCWHEKWSSSNDLQTSLELMKY